MLVGIVGRPNSGKSTFFKAATLADVLIANYPFATIAPNRGIAYVKIPDLAVEFGKISEPREGYVKGKWRFVPFELMDVAGLVEGASEGKGLGNEFLNDLASAGAFIHVVDMSGESDGEGKPCSGYDPRDDVRMIERELDLWYSGILKKVWSTFTRNLEMQRKKFEESVAKQFSGLKVSEEDVREVVLKHSFVIDKPSQWSENEIFRFAQELRKLTKPMLIAANKMDCPAASENYLRIKEEFAYPIIPCYADGELSLRQADKAGILSYVPGNNEFEIKKNITLAQKSALDSIAKFLNKEGSTGVQQILNSIVFDILKFVAVYPAGARLADSKGHILPDCFLMKKGSTALDFAYRLHTDIGRDFVKAVNIRTKKAVGKEYKLKQGDGLEILTK